LAKGVRINATGTDPNVGAAIAAMFVFYYFFKFVADKKFINIAMCSVALIMMLLTQSRTTLIGMCFSAIIYGLIFSRASLFVRAMVIVLVVGTLYYAVSLLNLDYIIDGLQAVQGGENGSLNNRIDNISKAIHLFEQSPVFGWGVAKAVYSTIIDCEYALILQRYGIIGVAVFGGYLIYHLRISLRAVKVVNNQMIFPRVSVAYVLFGVVIMATNDLFSGYQLMAILVLLLGLSWIELREAVSLRSPRRRISYAC
jgi:hypothetical protein